MRLRLHALESAVEQTRATVTSLEQKPTAPSRAPWSSRLLWMLAFLAGSAAVFAAGWHVARSLDKELILRDGLENRLDEFFRDKQLVARDEINKGFEAVREREKQFLTPDKLKGALAVLQGDDQVILKADLENRLSAFLKDSPIAGIASDAEAGRKVSELLAKVLKEGRYSGGVTFPRMTPSESAYWAPWVKKTSSIDFQSSNLRLVNLEIEQKNPQLWWAEVLKDGSDRSDRSVTIKYAGKGGDLARCVLDYTLDPPKERNSSGGQYVIVVYLYGQGSGEWRVLTLRLEPRSAKTR
jgi:hypothetical protein